MGQVSYAASQFAILSLLSHTAPAAIVGAYALALAVMAPVYTLVEMRLRLLLTTDAEGRFAFESYLTHRILSASLPILIVAAYTLVTTDANAGILMAITVYKGVESLLDLAYGAMTRSERLDLSAQSMLLRSVGNVLLFGTVLLPTQRVDVAYFALAVFNGACLFLALRHVRLLGYAPRFRFSRTDLRALSWLGLPLGASFAVGSLTVNVPRYFIQWRLGEESLAIFATAAYALVAATTVVNSLAHATTPRLSRYFFNNQSGAFRAVLRKTLSLAVVLGASGCVFAWLWGGTFLRIAFGPLYAEGSLVLLVLMGAAAAQYCVTFLREAFAAMQVYKVALPISAVNFLTVTAACFYVVDGYGIVGAAFAVLGGQALALSCYAVLFITLGRRRLAAL